MKERENESQIENKIDIQRQAQQVSKKKRQKECKKEGMNKKK